MTITICTDSKGRITAVVVPEGGCATVIEAPAEDAFPARFGGPGERVLKYDPDDDVGMAATPGWRKPMGLTVHRLR